MYEDYTDDIIRSREERIRTATFHGVEYTVQATDPYGFWHIVNAKSPKLQGNFTTSERALAICEAYENEKQKEKQKVEDSRTIWSTDGKGGKKRVPVKEHFSQAATEPPKVI